MFPPRLRSATSAPWTFQGRFHPRKSSSAYTRQPSSAPFGSWMFMNWTMRLSARSTPGTPRTRRTAVSGKVCAKSTFGVFFEVTQISAVACSIVTVALARRPMNRPTCTSTSVTAKATPATVIAKRRRSGRRFRRASETMSVRAGSARRLGQEAADGRVHDLLDGVGRGRRVRPALQVVEEAGEVLLAERVDEVVLVFEVVVDRRRRVLDRIGDAPHGDALVAFAGEEVARRGEDLAANLFAFSFPPFDHAHLAPPPS